MIIDTHTHFYDPTRPQGIPWPPAENELLYRTVQPNHHPAPDLLGQSHGFTQRRLVVPPAGEAHLPQLRGLHPPRSVIGEQHQQFPPARAFLRRRSDRAVLELRRATCRLDAEDLAVEAPHLRGPKLPDGGAHAGDVGGAVRSGLRVSPLRSDPDDRDTLI